jgi:hypothetical protein
MDDNIDLVEELLGMAKEPHEFTRADLGAMILVAATEIFKLREHAKGPSLKFKRQSRRALRSRVPQA